MSKQALNQNHNSVASLSGELVSLSDYNYENIFSMFRTEGGHYGYNLLRTLNIPKNLATNLYEVVKVNRKMSWTNVSYLEYGTIKLWWLVCLANHIKDPTRLPEPGTTLRIISKKFVPTILKLIKKSQNLS